MTLNWHPVWQLSQCQPYPGTSRIVSYNHNEQEIHLLRQIVTFLRITASVI